MRVGEVLTMTKEYIEREKAIEWFMAFVHMGESDIPAETVISDLKYAIPAADVAPAVRCQDFVYARPLKEMNYDYLCRYWNGHSCNQNQFCSQGERKEDI